MFNIMISLKLTFIILIALFTTSTNPIEDHKLHNNIINSENCVTGDCFLTGCINKQYACVTYGHEDYSCTSCNNECPDLVIEN